MGGAGLDTTGGTSGSSAPPSPCTSPSPTEGSDTLCPTPVGQSGGGGQPPVTDSQPPTGDTDAPTDGADSTPEPS